MEVVSIIGLEYQHQVVILQHSCTAHTMEKLSQKRLCQHIIPRKDYDAIKNGANFTHMFFDSKADMTAYLNNHTKRFQCISHSSSECQNGKFHLVY